MLRRNKRKRGGDQRLARVLGPFEAFAMVVSAVLGTSIFIVPAAVAAQVPFFAGIAGVWIAGGLFSLAGALTYAELGAMLPLAGGGYVYLDRAFGKLLSFLFVWTDFILVRAGAAAAISVGFAIYVSAVVPRPSGITMTAWRASIAIGLILVLGLLNVLGTKLSGLVQVAGTIFKAGAILLMIALPLVLFRHVHADYLRPVFPADWSGHTSEGLSAALVPVIWSYGGWDQLGHMAEEVKQPEKYLVRGFGFGLAFITMLYVGAAIAIHLVFPIHQVAGSEAIGSDFFRALMGSPGVALITGVVMFSGMTSAHMALMSGSRSCFAIGRGGLFPGWFGRLDPKFGTPANAVMALSGWACLLVLGNAVFGGTRPLYIILVTYVMFGLLLFGGLIFAAAIRLRSLHPDWERPYKVWGYPVTPLASMAVTVYLLWTMLRTSPHESFAALGIILLGVPVFLVRRGATVKSF